MGFLLLLHEIIEQGIDWLVVVGGGEGTKLTIHDCLIVSNVTLHSNFACYVNLEVFFLV